MYCEKCKRIIDAERCPFCRSRKVREPVPDDICFLAEKDYISSGILEDVLKQNEIPFLKKDVLGAGLAVKVGPMLEWSRFYVSYDRYENARSIAEDLFAESDAAGDLSEEDDGSVRDDAPFQAKYQSDPL